jgi:hypothetical protein
MEHLGFKAEQFRIEGEGPISVCVSPERGYYSEARERYIVLEGARYANRWWLKDGEVIVVFANATVHHLIGHEHHWGAAGELGVAQEKIQATREWFEAEKKKAEDNYRTQLREFVQSLQTHAAYSCLSKNIQERIARLAEFSDLSLVAEELSKLRPEWAKAEVLRRRVEAGECLTNFGGRFRVMGATSQAQYWVIRPDGSERLPDEVKYRTGYTLEGEKLWRLVGREELAISWFKAYTAADHEFVVNKLPVGGCTPQQLSAVERIAREIAERWPQNRVGKGWGLRK